MLSKSIIVSFLVASAAAARPTKTKTTLVTTTVKTTTTPPPVYTDMPCLINGVTSYCSTRSSTGSTQAANRKLNLDTFYAQNTALVDSVAKDFFSLVHSAQGPFPIGLNGPPDTPKRGQTLVQLIDAVQDKLYTLDRDLHHPNFINDPPEYAKYGLYWEDVSDEEDPSEVVPRQVTVDSAIAFVQRFQDALWGVYKWSTILPVDFYEMDREPEVRPEPMLVWDTAQASADAVVVSNVDFQDPITVLAYVLDPRGLKGNAGNVPQTDATFDDTHARIMGKGFELLGRFLMEEKSIAVHRHEARTLFAVTTWWQGFADDIGEVQLFKSLWADMFLRLAKGVTEIRMAAIEQSVQNNGTFNPPGTASSTSSANGQPGLYRGLSSFGAIPTARLDDDRSSIMSDGAGSVNNGRKRQQKMSTSELARYSGVKHPRLMYMSYYIPAIKWVPHYDLKYLAGDITAGITMASIYIPMALSLASNLAHVPPVQGLYSFAIVPIIYALLGSCPQMVTGPEAAGSLLVGEAVRHAINSGKQHDDDATKNAIVAGIVTTITGVIALMGGIVRLGFLDSVLSRALLRGFISAVGFVITVDQFIAELGLLKHAKKEGVTHASSLTKINFLITHVSDIHVPTAVLSMVSLVIILGFKKFRTKIQKRHNWVVFIPDRFLVVTIATILTAKLDWNARGIEILGDVAAGNFQVRFPFKEENIPKIREALPTAFLISVLGFFESVVAAKSLGSPIDANISSNRELVALGVGNIIAGFGCGLPSFGGYGRSKLNKSTGGRTGMSSVVLSFITLICIWFILPYFKYIPRCVLSSMITSVAFSLLEEAPADIKFFAKIRSAPDLLMMLIVFTLTIVYSLELGIAVGVGLSIVQILKHATRARIVILGRVPYTTPPVFKSAEEFPEEIVQIEGCLIVKIPEPLTFANAGDLKNRLKRLEIYGSTIAHPSLPRLRSDEHNRNVVFDVHGMTSVDGSGAQVLKEIVEGYLERDVRVFFARGPRRGGEVWKTMERGGIVGLVGEEKGFYEHVADALREMEGVDPDEGASITSKNISATYISLSTSLATTSSTRTSQFATRSKIPQTSRSYTSSSYTGSIKTASSSRTTFSRSTIKKPTSITSATSSTTIASWSAPIRNITTTIAYSNVTSTRTRSTSTLTTSRNHGTITITSAAIRESNPSPTLSSTQSSTNSAEAGSTLGADAHIERQKLKPYQNTTGIIAGSVIGAVGLLCGVVAVLVIFCQRAKNRAGGSTHAQKNKRRKYKRNSGSEDLLTTMPQMRSMSGGMDELLPPLVPPPKRKSRMDWVRFSRARGLHEVFELE
ncbi:hypothetical protein H072_10196 [Dactylellina haptotyla CBS 200.50]|uniref:STAS domain-containing protein n=1 Tax=Dactylellina haptotyla (strain CBS 200.50) TaxID=1284197 RepID=S8A0V9_DACHA|nr:hypothetical protein H072_10196 [Dactylellina haptotyla CBS 200.50]